MKRRLVNANKLIIFCFFVLFMVSCALQTVQLTETSTETEITTNTSIESSIFETMISTTSVHITTELYYEPQIEETTQEEIKLSDEEIRYNELCETYKEEIENDIWYLTCFLYGECRGSNQTLQSCCAWVILNAKGGSTPGNLHKTVHYYSDGSYYSYYITSFKSYNWSHEWTATEGKKAGKVFHLNSKLKTVEEKNPKIWNRCKDYATDVYHRWLKELSGYSAEEVGRTIPKNYLHFWNDKKANTGTVFPADWGQRYDHTKDFKIDYENSPYNK